MSIARNVVGDAMSRNIYLRHPASNDAGEFLERVVASRNYHRPWVRAPDDIFLFKSYMVRADTDSFQGLLACRREDDAIVGVTNLSVITRGALQSAYLGFYGFVPYEGQGYMTAAVGAVVSCAFKKLKLHRVEANVKPENTRSLALIKRCGFRREGLSPRYLKIGGRWQDHERWAILADRD